MFSEKNIPKLIILSPVIAIFLITFLTSYVFIYLQYSEFETQSAIIEKEFTQSKKNLLKKEIDTINRYLIHQEAVFSNSINEKVIKRTFILHSRLTSLYKDLKDNSLEYKKVLKNIINKEISKTNYFFAYDVKNAKIIQPLNRDIKKEFYEDEKFFENYLYSEEGKLIPFIKSNKTVFIKYLPKLDWIIGNIEDNSKEIKFLKKESKNFVLSLKFDQTGNFWLYNQEKRKNITDIGIKEHLEKTIDTQGEIYNFEYFDTFKNRKLSTSTYFERWDWVIGASLNFKKVQNEIINKKRALEENVDNYVSLVISISLIVLLIVTFLSIIISRKISTTIKDYQKKESLQKYELKLLNNSLSLKVKQAVILAQQKDRDMLHQSRLARLGSMLSMIAHQWRQPLSEVSSIILELETATKFNKINKELILDCTKDCDKLLNYMSDTIDDFRTFFKPDKEKVEFIISEACIDAISLMEGTLKELNIELIQDIKIRSACSGYPREFSQVILNLLVNAKDAFIKENIKNPKISFTIKKNKQNIIILISDNAGGISIDNIDLIFEPYYSTKNSKKATGMGLYMSKMIIENNMQGKLNVKNINKGVEFEIIL